MKKHGFPLKFCTIFLLFTIFPFSGTQAETEKFFSSNDKLSNSHVNSVHQDRQGYIWICTEDGLNVFDGSNFKTYYHIPGDPVSLNDNFVFQVLEDSHGNFWIGTTSGLQRYHRETDSFSDFEFSHPYTEDFRYVVVMMEDSKGNIWLSTSAPGVICLKSGDLQPVFYMQINSNICSDNINIIFEDSYGNIWLGSQNGVSVLNPENHIIVNHRHEPDNSNSLSNSHIIAISELPDGTVLLGSLDGGINAYDHYTKRFERNYIPGANSIFTIMKDTRDNIWIGTDGGGIKCYNTQTRIFTTYESNLLSFDLTKAKAHGFYEDLRGNVWVALFQKGILMIPPKEKTFKTIGFNPFNTQKSIGTDCVSSIMEDSKKQLWIGTDGDGLYRMNEKHSVIEHYKKNKLAGNCVLSIFEDSQKRIWVGTYLNGLFLYNPSKNTFGNVNLKADGQTVKIINCISEDKYGVLWLGTNGNGICRYNPQTNETSFIEHYPTKSGNQLLSNYIQTIFFAKSGLVWIGTGGAGISCYNPVENSFTDYAQQNGKLINNDVYVIQEDMSGNIWVGTRGGLNYINRKSGISSFYTQLDGLPNAAVCGVVIDKDNGLWISTCSGLSMFDTREKIFSNYTVSDGLINDEFRRSAYFQSPSGEIYFGGVNGVSYFRPFKSTATHQLINLVFTDLYVFNEKVKTENKKNAVLQKNLNAVDNIKLSYSTKSFSVGFVALEYNNPEKVIYQVKLDNFEKEWKNVPVKNKIATYTNLGPGEYVLKVKAHLEGTASVEKSLRIIITPPFWLSWWANILYIIILSGTVYYIYFTITKRIKRKQEKLRKENKEQSMQSKLQFFTDISHEIRTPLTLILTPVEQLIKETTDEKLKNTFQLIYRNGERILRLVNQIMEMRKLDRGQVKLKAEKVNLASFFRELMASFNFTAQEKQITFELELQESIPDVWIDVEKLDKVIFNVLSNAFKYTDKGGSIKIAVETSELNLHIRISDTGIGIPNDSLDLIFNRFYQVPDPDNKSKIGTGIGLHLSRSLMEIHHGKIEVESTSERGTTFLITLPLGSSYLKPDEIITEHNTRNLATLVQPSLFDMAVDTYSSDGIKNKKKKTPYTLLIVEDDSDVRNYLLEILNDDYHIIQSEDGQEGLEKAIQELPDCIITDLMMPRLDGISLCKKIKSNEKTCHIPIIMLTAKTSIEQRIEGLQTGADAYIPKPFSIEHLKTRISKLIELREIMKQKFEGRLAVNQEDVKIKSSDDVFLQKLDAYIKEQLSNSDLSVNTASRQIGMSRSQLQRKLKQLTNQNPSDYIKITRLRYAAELLLTNKFTISEIAYATGFSSLSHFSNSFKEFYGMTPTRYMEVGFQQNKK